MAEKSSLTKDVSPFSAMSKSALPTVAGRFWFQVSGFKFQVSGSFQPFNF
jgi:hypothetical protein